MSFPKHFFRACRRHTDRPGAARIAAEISAEGAVSLDLFFPGQSDPVDIL